MSSSDSRFPSRAPPQLPFPATANANSSPLPSCIMPHRISAPRFPLNVLGQNSPNCKTKIQPRPILFPPARRNRIHAHKNIRLDELDALPSINKRRRSGLFSEMHRDSVEFGAFDVITRGDCADYDARSKLQVLDNKALVTR